MKMRVLRLLFITLAILVIGSQAVWCETANERFTRDLNELMQPNQRREVRGIAHLALSATNEGADPSIIEGILLRLFEYQDMDPNSRTYGNFRWRTEDAGVTDPNSLEFTMHSLGPVLILYKDKLSQSFMEKAMPHIKAALYQLRKRGLKPDYTNICLMNYIGSILVGEAVGDKEAADFGYAGLDEFIRFTRREGIREYDSPTYYCVDIRALEMAYRFAERPEGKAKARMLLDYLWTDICANYFPGRQTFTGAFSRTYDFLHVRDINGYLEQEGLAAKTVEERAQRRKNSLAAPGYHPSDRILSLAWVPEKVIIQRTEATPRGHRYGYITPDFAIGSSTRDHENIDRPISIEFKTDKDLPVISVQPQPFDEPYGIGKIPGSNRSYHFFLHPTIVQEKGTMLALVDLDTKQMNEQVKAPMSCVSTDVVLPAKADMIALDGKPVVPSDSLKMIASDRSVVGIREGDAAVAIRIFRADACEKQRPVYALQADNEGLNLGAMRYTVYSYRGPEIRIDNGGHIRVGLLFIAGKCETDQDFAALMEKARSATFTEQTTGNLWEVKASVGDMTIEAGHDLNKRMPVYRRINEQEMKDDLFTVNGKDVGNALLDSVHVDKK